MLPTSLDARRARVGELASAAHTHRMRQLACAILLTSAAATLSACASSGGAACTPGMNRACSCGGSVGTQSCGAAGAWGACSCTDADGGGVDLGMDSGGSGDMGQSMVDAGDASISDSGSVDAAGLRAQVLASLPSLPVATTSVGTGLPDYSCRQAWDQDAPGGGTITDGTFNFDYGGAIGTVVDVKIFPNNDVPYDLICTGSCFTRPTNTSGTTSTFSLERGRFTSWATPTWTAAWGDVIVPGVGYFTKSDGFSSYGVRVALPSTTEIAELYASHSLTYTSDRSTMYGIVVDCLGRPVEGAAIRVFGETGLRDESDPPVQWYIPASGTGVGGEWTAPAGNVMLLDMRPADPRGTLMRIEAWANLGTSTPQLVACEKVRVFGGTMGQMIVLPRRVGGPSDCTP